MRTKNTDQWKQGLQQVIAIRPAADDMQEQVEFGGCGAGQVSFIQLYSCGFQSTITLEFRQLTPGAYPTIGTG